MLRTILLLPLALACVTACHMQAGERSSPLPPTSSSTPISLATSTALPAVPIPIATTPTPDQTHQEGAMYQAVVDTFFHDGQVLRLFDDDVLPHHVVYVQPTFMNSTTPLPPDLMQMIARHTAAHGLVAAPKEQDGGVVIALSSIGNDPQAATVYSQRGSTIQMSALVSGTSCGSFVSIGYLLTQTDAGWQAQQYLLAVC